MLTLKQRVKLFKRERQRLKKKLKREKRQKRKEYIKDFKENQRRGWKYSRGLKKKATFAEKVLRKALDNENIWYKFQAYFLDHETLYIPDFRLANKKHKIVIEVDGKSHKYQKEYDQQRDKWLKQKRNCLVLRFPNEEVLNNIDCVIDKIRELNPLLRNEYLQRRKYNNKQEKNILTLIQEFNNEYQTMVDLPNT